MALLSANLIASFFFFSSKVLGSAWVSALKDDSAKPTSLHVLILSSALLGSLFPNFSAS